MPAAEAEADATAELEAVEQTAEVPVIATAPVGAEEPQPAPTAGADAGPTDEPEVTEPASVLERGRIRRRARYLRQLREVQLRDIGGFALELHRYGHRRDDLVDAKVAVAAATDRELRALERALTRTVALRELRDAGIGGACAKCGAVHGSADRFCAACGTPLAGSEPAA
jgi:hypothetical protein